MVRRLRPPFRLAKFEGDAAFFYGGRREGRRLGAAGRRGGGIFAFREASSQHQPSDLLCVQRVQPDAGSRPQIRLPPTASSSREMSGRDELAGSDVILVHRLLKNWRQRVPRRPRLRAVFRPLHPGHGIDPVAQGLVEHSGVNRIIGEVTCWCATSKRHGSRKKTGR